MIIFDSRFWVGGVVLFLVFALCGHSWCACSRVNVNMYVGGNYYCGSSHSVPFGIADCTAGTGCGHSVGNISSGFWEGGVIYGNGYSSASVCVPGTNSSSQYPTILACTTQSEADSAYCALNPTADGCTPSCDSTHWECSTRVEHSQTTIANDNVQCFGGDCYGGVYCEYVSESITECRNDCGEITTQSSSVPIRYEGACNPDNLTDDTECTGVRCMSFEQTGAYTLYKLCASREIINGERKFFPRMIGGGKGTCKNAGYPESNGDSSAFGGGSSSDSASIPESCFTMGINCPSADTTNYNSSENRTPQNNCECEKLDGMSYISRIICPDGSVTAFYGSCDEWRAAASSSSSVPPESSSSGSENPPTSSGGELVGDWTTYEQGEDIKGILGVIAMNTEKQQSINNINNINVALDDYTTSISDSASPLVVPDSLYNPQSFLDTLGLADSIFKRVTDENTILDTLESVTGVCPCFTFFSGNGSQSSFLNNRIQFQEIKFDFSDFHGYNLCTIISVIVTGLASIVAFFIGFAIFKNVSQ